MVKINYKRNELIGKLIFLEDVPNVLPRKALFQCPSCSTQFVSEIARAKREKVISCGCFKKIKSSVVNTKHGEVKNGKMSPEYISWQRMIQRCENKNYGNFHNYGGRGIKVCERWRYSFINFLEDMGRKPFKRAQIDRIVTDGDYEPSNCRWISCKENARNRRDNRTIEWKGEKKTLSQWSEILNLNKNTLLNRLNSRNWTLEDTMTLPLFKKGQRRNKI